MLPIVVANQSACFSFSAATTLKIWTSSTQCMVYTMVVCGTEYMQDKFSIRG